MMMLRCFAYHLFGRLVVIACNIVHRPNKDRIVHSLVTGAVDVAAMKRVFDVEIQSFGFALINATATACLCAATSDTHNQQSC